MYPKYLWASLNSEIRKVIGTDIYFRNLFNDYWMVQQNGIYRIVMTSYVNQFHSTNDLFDSPLLEDEKELLISIDDFYSGCFNGCFNRDDGNGHPVKNGMVNRHNNVWEKLPEGTDSIVWYNK